MSGFVVSDHRVGPFVFQGMLGFAVLIRPLALVSVDLLAGLVGFPLFLCPKPRPQPRYLSALVVFTVPLRKPGFSGICSTDLLQAKDPESPRLVEHGAW